MSGPKTKADFLKDYLEAWTEGKGDRILEATALSYTLDDPNIGHTLHRSTFKKYFDDLFGVVRGLQDPHYRNHFKESSEVVAKEDLGVLTAYCWWHVPGTHIQGSSLIKVSDGGILSEKVAFYNKLPELAAHAWTV